MYSTCNQPVKDMAPSRQGKGYMMGVLGKCLSPLLFLLVPSVLGTLNCSDDKILPWRDSCILLNLPVQGSQLDAPQMIRFKRGNSSAHSLELVVSLDNCACRSVIVKFCRAENCSMCKDIEWQNITDMRLSECSPICWQINTWKPDHSYRSRWPVLPDESCANNDATNSSTAHPKVGTVTVPAGFKESASSQFYRPGETSPSSSSSPSSSASTSSAPPSSSFSPLSSPPSSSSSSSSSSSTKSTFSIEVPVISAQSTTDQITTSTLTEVTFASASPSFRKSFITETVSATVVLLVLLTVGIVICHIVRQHKSYLSPEGPNSEKQKGEPTSWSITVGGEDGDSMLSVATVDGLSYPRCQNDTNSCFTYHGSDFEEKCQNTGRSVSVCMKKIHVQSGPCQDDLCQQGLTLTPADFLYPHSCVVPACSAAPSQQSGFSLPESSSREGTLHFYYGLSDRACSLRGDGHDSQRLLSSVEEESLVSTYSEEFSPPDNFQAFDHHTLHELYDFLDSFNEDREV